jgi:hypothetical protein
MEANIAIKEVNIGNLYNILNYRLKITNLVIEARKKKEDHIREIDIIIEDIKIKDQDQDLMTDIKRIINIIVIIRKIIEIKMIEGIEEIDHQEITKEDRNLMKEIIKKKLRKMMLRRMMQIIK